MPRSFFLINLILFIIIVLLGVRFFKVWTGPLEIPVQKPEKQAQIGKKTPMSTKKNLKESAYEVIVQKDLFRPERSAPNVKNTSTVSSSGEKPKLFGTMIMNNENVAILEDPSTKTTKLYRVNDSIAGLMVSEIKKDKVVLLRGVEKIEVKLRDLKGFKSPSSTSVKGKKLERPRKKPRRRPPRPTRKPTRER